MMVRLKGYKNIPITKATKEESTPACSWYSALSNLFIIADARTHRRNARATSKTMPPLTAKFIICDVESKNFTLDNVVFAKLDAPNLSKAREKFSGPYPNAGLFFKTPVTTSPERPKDGATSIGRPFFKAEKSKLTIIRNTPSTIRVMGNMNLEILNFETFKLSPCPADAMLSIAIKQAIPAIATTHKAHQFNITSKTRARKAPTFPT